MNPPTGPELPRSKGRRSLTAGPAGMDGEHPAAANNKVNPHGGATSPAEGLTLGPGLVLPVEAVTETFTNTGYSSIGRFRSLTVGRAMSEQPSGGGQRPHHDSHHQRSTDELKQAAADVGTDNPGGQHPPTAAEKTPPPPAAAAGLQATAGPDAAPTHGEATPRRRRQLPQWTGARSASPRLS